MNEVVQGSREWLDARLGKATASRIADIVAKTKSGYSASRANYAAQLVAERLTGTVAESYTNAAMQWGTANEADARTAYRFYSGNKVTECGFIIHPSIPESGASPDGLVSDDGLVEIKCPNTATHIETLLGQSIPEKYVTQMMWQMACTGRQWCDFASYDPRLPDAMSIFVKRLPRDEARIKELEVEVSKFLSEIETTVSRLRDLYEEKEAA